MTTELVETRISGSVGLVILNRPDRRNALNIEMAARLIDVLDTLESDMNINALVITGEGTSFCAGADLADRSVSDRGQDGPQLIYAVFDKLAKYPLPTVAAVNGPAIGAGMNIALSCDVRLASTLAVFDSRFIRLDLHPGGGHLWNLHRHVGYQPAMAIGVFGAALDGDQAASIGLAWRCVGSEELLATALKMASVFDNRSRELVMRVKSTVAMSPYHDRDEAVALEAAHQAWSVDQPAFQSRMQRVHDKGMRAGEDPGKPVAFRNEGMS